MFQLVTILIFCIIVALYEFISYQKKEDLIGIAIKYFQENEKDDDDDIFSQENQKKITVVENGSQSSCSTPENKSVKSIVIEQSMIKKNGMDFIS